MCLGQPHGKMTNRYPNNRRAFEKRQLNWKTFGDLGYLFVQKKVPIGHIPTSFFTARRFFFDTRNFGNRALTGHQLFGNLGTVGCRGVGECVSQKKTYLAKQSDLIKLLGVMPPKFNIDLEKWWLEDDPSLLGRELFRGYVKFLRGTYFFRLKRQKMRRESSARRFPEHLENASSSTSVGNWTRIMEVGNFQAKRIGAGRRRKKSQSLGCPVLTTFLAIGQTRWWFQIFFMRFVRRWSRKTNTSTTCVFV